MDDLGNLTAQQLLDELSAVERQRAIVDARRFRLLAQYHSLRAESGEFAERSAPEEVALQLHVTSNYAASQMYTATNLITRLPDTFAALASGRISEIKARALVDITNSLSVEDARAVEAKVLPRAETRDVGQVRSSARYYRDRIDPVGAAQRRQHAADQRAAYFQPLDNGFAEFGITGPGERVYLAWLLVDTLARRMRTTGDERTLDQLRCDLTLDLILGKHDHRVQVHAYVHVPATTLAGITDDPGILAGYGPVTAETCRELAGRDTFWRRIFTDPITGTVKDVDRRTYRPPDALAEFIQIRDQTCVAPGCSRPSQHCQIDHTIAWAHGGCTCEDNLGAMCHRHHRMKDLCGWYVTQPEPGRFQWVSPVGQIYEHIPESVFNP